MKNVVNLGIDFGTTYSCVGFYNPTTKQVEILVDQIPTCLLFENINKGPVIIGHPAKNSLLKTQTIFNLKRIIGKEKTEINKDDQNNLPFAIKIRDSKSVFIEIENEKEDTKKLRCEEVTSIFLYELLKMALAKLPLNITIEKVIIPVPVDFADAQRTAIIQSASLAGLDNVKAINEPLAALISYQNQFPSEIKDGMKVLVIDFGGGTLDISNCVYNKGEAKATKIGGDQNLGGIDFDKKIKEFIIEKLKEYGWCLKKLKVKGETKKHRSDRLKLETRILNEAERIKIQLSSRESVEVEIQNIFSDDDINDNDRIDSIIITKEDFEEISVKLIERFKECISQNIQGRKVDKVILIGGSCQMPIIRESVKNKFGEEIISSEQFRPLTAVVEGATLYANKSNFEIQKEPTDTIPIQLGIDSTEGIIPFAIPGESLPIKKVLIFKNECDDQKTAKFEVFRGSGLLRDSPGNKRILGFVVDGIPPAPKQTTKFQVNVTVNKSGLLQIEASVEGSNIRNGLTTTIDLSYEDSDVEEMKKTFERYCPN